MDSSLRLCCLMQISTQFFVSEDFDRSITYYDMLDKYSRSSPDIVRSLHLSVKPLILFDSTTLKPWVKRTKVNFFLLVVNACTIPHVEQIKKTDQTCHTYRHLRQVLLISKEIHPAQKIRCKSKTLKLMRCTKPLSYNAYL